MHDFYLIKKTETQDEEFFEYFWRDIEQYKDLIVAYIGLEDNIVDYILIRLHGFHAGTQACLECLNT